MKNPKNSNNYCPYCKSVKTKNDFYYTIQKYTKKDGTVSEYPSRGSYCKDCTIIVRKKYPTSKEAIERDRLRKKSEEYKTKERAYKATSYYKFCEMFTKAKGRAREKGIEYTIDRTMFSLPKKCSILDIDLVWGTPKSYGSSPSLDRKDPNIGYTKENTRIISMKANTMKSDASKELMFNFVVGIINYMGLNVDDIVRAVRKKKLTEVEDKEPLR